MSSLGFAAALIGALLTLSEWAQAIGLFLLVVGFAVATPSRRAMRIWHDNAEAEKARGDRLQEELTGAAARANEEAGRRADCEREIAHLEGQLKTMERYTAQAALETVGERMATLETAIVTTVQGNNDLVLQTHAVLKELREAITDLAGAIAAKP